MNRYESQLKRADPGFQEVLRKVPLQDQPPLPLDWLRTEMLERLTVLQYAAIVAGAKVLEVGAGGHAITTVALAYLVGPRGRVTAVERERWTHFHEIVAVTGMEERVLPVACDARRLPFPPGNFGLAVCVHAIRSLRSEATMVEVFREMMRVSTTIFLAESLPIARTEAQRAHLAMYNLREEVFEAASGVRDDLHYLPLERLAHLVERAGGSVLESKIVEIDLPHALAYFPEGYVQQVPDSRERNTLLRQRAEADELRRRHGTDHPPVGVVVAQSSRSR